MDNNSFNTLEVEIAELQKKIDEKRNILENQNGIIEERELVSSALSELFTGVGAQTTTNQVTPASDIKFTSSESPIDSGSYLDQLDDQTTTNVTSLIEELPNLGIAKVVAKASAESPFLVDVLHDALVDKLYGELVSRGLVKEK